MSVEGLRYAHCEGRVCVEYSRNGAKIHTLGLDGEMRVWAGIDDDDCENIVVGEEGLAMAVATDRIFVAPSESNSVQALNMDGDNDGVITKFTADVTCLDTISSGALLVAGSADMTIKVSDTANYTDKVLSGHKGPILSVALDPLKKFVASSSCDGTVKIWDISSKSQVKSFDWIPKSNDGSNSKTVCQLRFNNSGSCLAIPNNTSVSVLKRESWEEVISLTSSSLKDKEIFTAASWNSAETMVIAGTSKGNICVWSTDGTMLHFIESARNFAISAMAWNPTKDNEASFGDSQGYWGLVGSLGSKGPGDEDLLSKEELGELFNDDDDENSFSISKIQAETGFAKDEEGHLIHGEAELGSSRPGSAASSYSAVNRAAPAPVEIRLQASFQPSSSPDHFNYRFLVYNHVGIVKTIQENNIDVDFHDSSTHYNLFFRNPDNYTMAALTDKVLVLAREGDDELPGKVTVHNFKSSESNNEWSMDLADGELVLGVAAGEGWVAAATSNNYLRMFTAWGIQREIISLCGPLVSMVGSGSKLFLTTHSAHPLPKQQNFCYYVVGVNFRRGLCSVTGPLSLPVTPDTELYWVGISDTKLPVTTDTAGVVRMLLNSAWYPICDTKAQISGKSDTFFVSCVDQKDMQVRGVKCRGSRYPQTIPKPSPSSLSLEVPFLITGERGGLEQRLICSTLLSPVVKSDPELDASNRSEESECLMKIFALACRSDQDNRALEVCKLMSDTDSIQMAIQYAAKTKRVGLVSKLGELALRLQEVEDVEEENEEADEEAEVDKQKEEPEQEFTSQQDSQDMFAEFEDVIENPLLASKPNSFKKELVRQPFLSSAKQENRNPFAKKKPDNRSLLDNSPGAKIVFDSPNHAKPLLPKRTLLIPKQKNKALNKEKENTSGELKGFQLYLAESQDEFPGTQEESQEAALQSWKSMDRSSKDQYKASRLPSVSGKRKRSEDNPSLEGKKTKPSFSSKLSGFAFGGN